MYYGASDPQPVVGYQTPYPPTSNQGPGYFAPPGAQGYISAPGNQGGYPPDGVEVAPPHGMQGYAPPPGMQGYVSGPGSQPGYPPTGGVGYTPPPVIQPLQSASQPQTQPYTTQPQPGEWIQPSAQPGFICPPGLEYLVQIDQLLIKQKVELLEAFTGFETKNKYDIKNSMGQKVYYAKEDTDCCTRLLCGPLRPMNLMILDNSKREVIHLNRPLACDSCLFPCCLQTMEVSSPPGTIIGTVRQEWSILSPKFSVCNASGDVVLTIKGPICTWSICGDVEFMVCSADGNTQVGKISKQWSGLLREAFTDAENFGISFPMNLDVKIKAVLLGAVFLMDLMFFEKKGNKESDGLGML